MFLEDSSLMGLSFSIFSVMLTYEERLRNPRGCVDTLKHLTLRMLNEQARSQPAGPCTAAGCCQEVVGAVLQGTNAGAGAAVPVNSGNIWCAD